MNTKFEKKLKNIRIWRSGYLIIAGLALGIIILSLTGVLRIKIVNAFHKEVVIEEYSNNVFYMLNEQGACVHRKNVADIVGKAWDLDSIARANGLIKGADSAIVPNKYGFMTTISKDSLWHHPYFNSLLLDVSYHSPAARSSLFAAHPIKVDMSNVYNKEPFTNEYNAALIISIALLIFSIIFWFVNRHETNMIIGMLHGQRKIDAESAKEDVTFFFHWIFVVLLFFYLLASREWIIGDYWKVIVAVCIAMVNLSIGLITASTKLIRIKKEQIDLGYELQDYYEEGYIIIFKWVIPVGEDGIEDKKLQKKALLAEKQKEVEKERAEEDRKKTLLKNRAKEFSE